MIGRIVSHYKVVDELGGGGMGRVYRAEDTRLGRDAALKFLPPDLTRDPEARERFKLEARAASSLDHANICTIYDVDETEDGQLFIAMAFYAGQTLKAKLAAGPLELQEVVDIAGQVADGLASAHENGIVHRDIKPANLMVTERGRVKILDFGVAKLAGEVGITRTGTTLGTLAYMAPEQIEGTAVGPATDLWALGVILYQMLTGTLPFSGRTEAETIAAILAVEPEPPGARRADVPGSLERLVVDLLTKDPKHRAELSRDIVQHLASVTQPAAAPTTTALMRKPVAWVVGAAIMAVLVAAIVLPARRRARTAAALESLAEIESLANERRFSTAYALATQAEQVLGSDTTLQRLMEEVSDVLSVRSDPEGADLYVQTFEGGDAVPADQGSTGPGTEHLLGRTPIGPVRLVRGDHLITVVAAGHDPVERVASSLLARNDGSGGRSIDIVLDVELLPSDSIPKGMVYVPAGLYTLVSADAPAGAAADLEAFFIDRFEVSNAEYREFVRAGYSDPALWPSPMLQGGRALDWDEAAALLRDRTGLPGPRSWTGQEFPDGAARHPVASITWYEAAAYCRWRGKSLPTLFEWEKAARGGAFTHTEGLVFPWGLVPPGRTTENRANFGGSGTAEVDRYPLGLSPFGAHAMAGNVREWTTNAAGDGYVAMGGSWQDPPYVFPSIATPDPWSASPGLGVRCVRRAASPEQHGAGPIDLARRSPSYRPVSRSAYESFLTHYRYDPVDLEPETVETLETEDWTRHKVRFNGVGADTIIAYLYLPSNVQPPYQTMVFVPGLTAFFADPIQEETEWLLGANIRSGRAALAVVLDGMLGRDWPPGTRFPPSNTVEFRHLMVRHATELRLGLDYLENRQDIDTERLAYVGLSWGSGSRATLAATDDRLNAVVFVGAGIDERLHPTVPEALNVNFIPYIDLPTLMLNGRQDEEHPWLTRGLPFWELLREPKELILADNEGHVPSLEVRVPAINEFLDRTLGVVR